MLLWMSGLVIGTVHRVLKGSWKILRQGYKAGLRGPMKEPSK
jgi:hypothetical protein